MKKYSKLNFDQKMKKETKEAMMTKRKTIESWRQASLRKLVTPLVLYLFLTPQLFFNNNLVLLSLFLYLHFLSYVFCGNLDI